MGNRGSGRRYREGGAVTICGRKVGDIVPTPRSPAAIGRGGLLLFVAEERDGEEEKEDETLIEI